MLTLIDRGADALPADGKVTRETAERSRRKHAPASPQVVLRAHLLHETIASLDA
jgi:hypothetical protein